MNAIRLLALVSIMIGLCLADASGQVAKTKLKKGAPTPPPTAESLSGPLVAADVLAKLKLTAQQQESADKLAQEFATRNKRLTAKLPAPTTPAAPAKGKLKGKAGKGAPPATLPAELQAVLTLRVDYEKKFEALLTDQQRQAYDAVLARKAEALLIGK